MSAYMMHTDPRVYKNPHEFVPERWLGEVDPLMKRNLVPFSKGSRNCLGMKYLTLLSLFSHLTPHFPFLSMTDKKQTRQPCIRRNELHARDTLPAWRPRV